MVCPVEVLGKFDSFQRAATLGSASADGGISFTTARTLWLMMGQDERHGYEKCQYVEFKKRVAKMDELRESKGGERTN